MGIRPGETGFPFLVGIALGPSAKLHGLREFDALDLPGEAFAQPGVRRLDLVTVFQALVKHAVLVANPVTHDGQA